MTAVADTSFLIALIDRSDPRHEATQTTFQEAGHVLISTEVLVETLGVIKVKVGRAAAAGVLEDLMRTENVGWEEHCDMAATYRIYQDNQALSFPDAVVVHHCLKTGGRPLTYDEAQLATLARL